MVVLMNHFPAELFAAQKSFPSDMQYDDLVSSCSPFFLLSEAKIVYIRVSTTIRVQ